MDEDKNNVAQVYSNDMKSWKSSYGGDFLKKKVLLVSCEGLGNGGVQAVIMSIVRNLSHKYTFDIVLFTNEKRYYDDEFLSYGGEIIRIPHYKGKNRFARKADYYIRGSRIYKGILKCIDEHGPYCAIHCNNYFESALCLKAAQDRGIPVRIAHIHAVIQKEDPIREILNNCYKILIERAATHRFGCSEKVCESMFGESTNAEVLLNPYDSKRFQAEKYAHKKNDYLTITQVGGFCANKNQIFSIRVMAQITRMLPNAEMYLVGFDSNGYKSYLEDETRKLRLEKNVILFPHDADAPELLSKSHIAMVPSIFEGFGIVAVEAQAMGVHCFASDSVPRITNAGGCTYLPLSLGEKEWAKHIVSWYQNNKNLPQYYDCSDFTEQAIMLQYDRLYGGIV